MSNTIFGVLPTLGIASSTVCLRWIQDVDHSVFVFVHGDFFTKYRSFIITDLPIAQVQYPPVCVNVGVCHFFLSLRFECLELALLS